MPKITLIRHGRSAHVVKGLLDLAAFRKWREAYEAAGIDPADRPPPELHAAAEQAAIIVSSDAPRAIESARKLAPDRDVITSPLLRELRMEPPALRWIRLPMAGWALVFGVQWLRRKLATPEDEQRARAAADWLIDLAAGDLVVVTHGSFRLLLAREFESRGWVLVLPRRRSSHWSAWAMKR